MTTINLKCYPSISDTRNKRYFKPFYSSWVTLVFDSCCEATTTRSTKRCRCSFRALRNPRQRAILWSWFVPAWRKRYAEMELVTKQWGGGWCVISGKAMDKAIRYISSLYAGRVFPWFCTIRVIAVLCMTTKRVKRLSCSDLLRCRLRRRSVIQRRSMRRSGRIVSYSLCYVVWIWRFIRTRWTLWFSTSFGRFVSYPFSHVEYRVRLREVSRRVCSGIARSSVSPLLSVEIHHNRLRTAVPRDRFSKGNQLVAGRASRSDLDGDSERNQLSHLAHASEHKGIFREERAVDDGFAMAEVHCVGGARRSDWNGGVQVSRVFRHRDDVSLIRSIHCRNADNGFYDDELAECFEQRRNVVMTRIRNE